MTQTKNRYRSDPDRKVRTNTDEPEQRFSTEPLEVRNNPKNPDQLLLRGYPIVFAPAEGRVNDRLGSFSEYVMPGATRGLESERIALTVNHNSGPAPLAATWNGTVEWSEDSKGVRMLATLDTNRQDCNDAAAAVASGILSAMSFAFNNDPKQGFRDQWTNGFQKRTIQQFGGLSDFSLVSFPAYEAASVEVAQRALARSWRMLDYAETGLRSGKTLSKDTVGQLTNAVGSILSAGQHISDAHGHVTKLLTSNGINIDALPGGGNQDGTSSGGGAAGGGWQSQPMADGAGRSRFLSPREQDLLELYLERLEDEERQSNQKAAEARAILAEVGR